MLGRAAQRIVRFHTCPTIEVQTVGAHTFGLCLILVELTNGDCSAALLKAALFHDMAEAKVGDTPSPILREAPLLKQAYKEAELKIDIEYDLLVDLTADEQRLLKLADRMELALFALEDADRGNLQGLAIAGRVIASIERDELVVGGNGNEVVLMEQIKHRYKQRERREVWRHEPITSQDN